MVKEIQYLCGLSFEDVAEYIPTLTTDNDVVTDGAIIDFQVQYFEEEYHLFVDTSTMQYCFNADYSDGIDSLLSEIGDIILAKCHFFKDDLDELVDYIYENITFCEVQLCCEVQL